MQDTRYIGSAILPSSYNVTDYHPLDTRQLVPTFAALTREDNWVYAGESIAYNGMLVVVGNEEANKGVYYLFDKEKPGAEDIPDVSNPDNWYKLGVDPDTLTQEDLNKAIEELTKGFEETYVKNDDAFAALKTSVSSNADAIKALLAEDTGSIRAIAQDAAQDEIARQVVTPSTSLGALALRIGSNEQAIKALQESGGLDTEILDQIIDNAISNLNASHIIENNEDYDIGYNENNKKELTINKVGISKLYQDVQFILSGGSAKQDDFN
jgi:arsenate reductase-like glutaredoxin family protein